MKKKLVQKLGKCICGSTDIEYGGTRLEGESIGYNFTCHKCSKHCIEWYSLVYSETREV